MSKRVVVYLTDQQLAVMKEISSMLGISSQSGAVKHCMVIGMAGLRTQVSNWQQSAAIDRMVETMQTLPQSPH